MSRIYFNLTNFTEKELQADLEICKKNLQLIAEGKHKEVYDYYKLHGVPMSLIEEALKEEIEDINYELFTRQKAD